MARPRKYDDEPGLEAPEQSEAPVRVEFIRFWSADRGVFLPGEGAELPEYLAQSLAAEGVVKGL